MTHFTDTLKLITLARTEAADLMVIFKKSKQLLIVKPDDELHQPDQNRCATFFACAVPVCNSCVDLECFPPAQVLKIAERSQKIKIKRLLVDIMASVVLCKCPKSMHVRAG